MKKVERVLFAELVNNFNKFGENLAGYLYEANEEQIEAHRTYGCKTFNEMVKLVNSISRMNQAGFINDIAEQKKKKKVKS